MAVFRCVVCGVTAESEALDPVCTSCGGSLTLEWPRLPAVGRRDFEVLPPGVWRYNLLLPEAGPDGPVTLGEGGTPLLRGERLGEALGLRNLLIKDETRNPTGSIKDRGSTVLVTMARRRGVRVCSCRTTGNLGASLAAYCAKAGIAARVSVTPGVDRVKLYQMIAYGAEVEASGTPDEGPGGASHSLSVTAGNPYVLEGEKTTCFEVLQELAWKPPDAILVPVGTGGQISMTWRALGQLRDLGLLDGKVCRLLGVRIQSENRAVGPRSRAARGVSAEMSFAELDESEPFFLEAASRAIEESRGTSISVTTPDTLRATGLLARTEGIFAEPVSASVVAALQTARNERLVDSGEVVVCVITGAGLKDTKAIARLAKSARQVVVGEEYGVARIQIGETKLSLLRYLSNRPRFGYELWKELAAGRSITTASVYQHLGELEGLGLVRRSGVDTKRGRERIFYDLTRRGSYYLRMASQVRRNHTK